jgi:hypothetical protein
LGKNRSSIMASFGSPQPTPQELENLFITGVRATFYRWTVLRLAVQNGWGGGNAVQKEEDMILDVLGLFGKGAAALNFENVTPCWWCRRQGLPRRGGGNLRRWPGRF